MERTVVKTLDAPAPVGPYNQAIAASGRYLFLAGQIAIDPATNALVAGGVKEQTHRICKNIGAVLSEAGATFANVVKTTVFLTDMNDFAAMNEIYSEYFGSGSPARSTVGVAGLPKGGKVEIEVIAVL